MSTTFIRACKTSDEADTETGFRKGLGFEVVRVEKTDRLQLFRDGGDRITWESGAEGDFILVISTKDGVTTG